MRKIPLKIPLPENSEIENHRLSLTVRNSQ
jgi:hypothetical protein